MNYISSAKSQRRKNETLSASATVRFQTDVLSSPRRNPLKNDTINPSHQPLISANVGELKQSSNVIIRDEYCDIPVTSAFPSISDRSGVDLIADTSTQTEFSELPDLVEIELKLSNLREIISEASNSLSSAHQTYIKQTIDQLHDVIYQRLSQIDKNRLKEVKRVRAACRVTLGDSIAKIKKEYEVETEKKLKEVKDELEKVVNEKEKSMVKFKKMLLNKNEEIARLKAQLAKSYEWVRKKMGESESQSLESSNERETYDLATLVSKLQDDLIQRDSEIEQLRSKLKDLSEKLTSKNTDVENSKLQAKRRSARLDQIATINPKTEQFSDDSSQNTATNTVSTVPDDLPATGSSLTSHLELSTTPLSSHTTGRPTHIPTPDNHPPKYPTSTQPTQNPESAISFTRQNDPRSMNSESSNPSSSIDTIDPSQNQHEESHQQEESSQSLSSDVETRKLIDQVTQDIETKWNQRLEKVKLRHQGEVARYRSEIEKLRNQIDVTLKSFSSFNDPSRISQILTRQQSLLQYTSHLHSSLLHLHHLNNPNHLNNPQPSTPSSPSSPSLPVSSSSKIPTHLPFKSGSSGTAGTIEPVTTLN
ncbi:hypothetical protein BKA69DRAFT_395395 [Paraphysoderma sedebokerense]|nr:hypothetical protein BKA69DRAFT_395395 [Paraphysoderma sedebokerense]